MEWPYSEEDLERIRWGFVPYSMEERWYIGVEDEKLLFYRSSSGILCTVAHLSKGGIFKLEIWRESREPADQIKHLIDRYLVGAPE